MVYHTILLSYSPFHIWFIFMVLNVWCPKAHGVCCTIHCLSEIMSLFLVIYHIVWAVFYSFNWKHIFLCTAAGIQKSLKQKHGKNVDFVNSKLLPIKMGIEIITKFDKWPLALECSTLRSALTYRFLPECSVFTLVVKPFVHKVSVWHCLEFSLF